MCMHLKYAEITPLKQQAKTRRHSPENDIRGSMVRCGFGVVELTHEEIRNRCMMTRDRTGDQ